MPILTESQIKEVYFRQIGGFPPLNQTQDRTNFAREVKDYNGQKKLCIACTQLDSEAYSEREKKRVLLEWIDFLSINTKVFRALHFNSRVPQALLDAACCQENLEELRFKWGGYSDLTALEKLKKLKFLYVGQGSSVKDITPISRMKSLVVLYVESFKKIEDYSPLSSLDNLEQLVISGPILGTTPIKDLEFLREMQELRSLGLGNLKFRKKYTSAEIADLRAALPNLHDINNCAFGDN